MKTFNITILIGSSIAIVFLWPSAALFFGILYLALRVIERKQEQAQNQLLSLIYNTAGVNAEQAKGGDL